MNTLRQSFREPRNISHDRTNARALYNSGKRLERGEDDVKKDVPAAAELYRRAAELGHAKAMNNLGNLLRHGEDGITKDVPEAAKLYRRAAELGHAKAMNNLGVLLRHGEDGITKDVPAAAKLYKQAADLGHADAMNNLGNLLLRGEDGISKDVLEAAKLYRLATELGHVDAMNSLTVLLRRDEAEVLRDVYSKCCKYDAFISHAGPQKLAIARPIYRALDRQKLLVFLDMENLQINDCTAAEAMEHAMSEAHIGIFVLSVDFVSRRWTMKELRCFLERDEACRADGRPRPVLLPIFLGLTVHECRQAEFEVYGKGSRYREVMRGNGFFEEGRQAECSTATAVDALKRVAGYSGVEVSRIGGGTDLSSAEIVEETVRRVRKYFERPNRAA